MSSTIHSPVSDVRDARAKLERTIEDAINAFTDEYGCTYRDIRIDVHRVMGQPPRVSRVTIETELGRR